MRLWAKLSVMLNPSKMSNLGPYQENTIVCNDCLNVLRNLPDNCVDLVATSPPYNCRMDYGVSNDQVPWQDWYQLIGDVLTGCHRVLREGGVIALNIPLVVRWQRDHAFKDTWSDYDPEYLTHVGGQRNQEGKGRIEPLGFRVFGKMEQVGFKMREPIIWVKGSEGNAICSDYRMGCDSDPYMRPAHETILLGSKGRWFHDGGTGRRGKEAVPFLEETKDVWFLPPVSIKGHPAIFPVELPSRLIRLFVHRANTKDLPKPVIFDPFVGSGTTAIAAARLGHNFFGVDINREYVALALDRLAKDREQRAQLELGC